MECTVDEQRQHAVLTATARQLRDMIARGSLTCSDVVSTYAYRASTLGAELNLNAEECFQEAADAARGVGADAGTEALLRGVPVSIKDQYFQQGYDATCGAACKAFRPAEQDGLLVELLRDAGAIPFVRSNVPQCLMVPESDNYVVSHSFAVCACATLLVVTCLAGCVATCSGAKLKTRTTPTAPRTCWPAAVCCVCLGARGDHAVCVGQRRFERWRGWFGGWQLQPIGTRHGYWWLHSYPSTLLRCVRVSDGRGLACGGIIVAHRRGRGYTLVSLCHPQASTASSPPLPACPCLVREHYAVPPMVA